MLQSRVIALYMYASVFAHVLVHAVLPNSTQAAPNIRDGKINNNFTKQSSV